MKRLYQHIHSPSSLLAFEAAARLSSFTKAADELNVSQPAISLSVKKIETALGVDLFERSHRAIRLTEIGERFYADVSFGLNHILRSAEEISVKKYGHHVTLNCSTAFAHYWMIPRLPDFRERHPGIEIRLQTASRDIDPDGADINLSIRRGTGTWEGCNAKFIAKEKIYPVCSPNFFEGREIPNTPEDLIGQELIHLEEPFRLRPKWSDWFQAHGLDWHDQGDGLRLNDYALVLQAALSGQGIAYGWDHLVGPLIRQKQLIKLMDGKFDAHQGFYVIWSKNHSLSGQAEQFRDWLCSNTWN